MWAAADGAVVRDKGQFQSLMLKSHTWVPQQMVRPGAVAVVMPHDVDLPARLQAPNTIAVPTYDWISFSGYFCDMM